MNNSSQKFNSLERRNKTSGSSTLSTRPPTADGCKSKPPGTRQQLKPISTPVNTSNSVRSGVTSSGASASSRKCRPLVESHRQAMRVERDILGLPIKSERHAETPLNSVRSCANQETPSHGRMVQNRVEKMSLFEALELADSIENQENTCQFKPDAGHDTFEQSVTSDITTDSVDLESSDLRRNATCSSTSSAESIKDTRNIHAAVVGINAAPIKSSASFSCSKSQAFKNTPETISVYNRYLRSVFLSKTLEDAHKKRKASAFSQLTALAEENNRLEDQICQLKMDSEKQAYNQVIWDLISVQSEQTAKLAAKLNNFLPLFTKFALLVDSTRHRFFFENINVPSYQIDPESNLRFCAKLTEQLEIQKSLLESIANEEKRSSKHDLQRLVELGEKFLESSKEVDKDIKQCEEKCRELFMCIEQKDSSDLPAILNSVSCVDNCNLDIFKF